MTCNWFQRIIGTHQSTKGKDRRRRPIRASRRLIQELLETRTVPSSTITYQQGIVPSGGSDPYAGTTEVRIDSSNPLANIVNGVGATNGFYFLDGLNSGDLGSPNQWDLIRFDSVFGSNPDQIPAGSIIRSATLTYHTGTTADSGSSPSGGPYGASQLLVPFDSTTTWNSFGGNSNGLEYGVQANWPTGAFRNSSTTGKTGSFSLSADNDELCDVTQAVQNWAANPAANLGVLISQLNTNDGWGIKSVAAANLAQRPSLSITFDPPPTSAQVATFQQGINGYYGAVSAWVQQNATTTDGLTLANPVFLDGNLPTDPTSPDDQMLIKFTNMFGSAPGQIPFGSTIQSAQLVISTGSLLDSGNAQSGGPWEASQIKVDWNTTTKYTDAAFGGNGLNTANSKTTTFSPPGTSSPELTVLSNVYTIGPDGRAAFDITSAMQAWLDGTATNYGIDIQANTTSDGWDVHFPGSANVAARPRLVVTYTTSAASEPVANTADLVSGAFGYVGGAGLANNVNVSVSGGIFTVTDNSGPITLTATAQLAGWTGNGTNTITGPSSSLTVFNVNTGTGNDTVTLGNSDKPINVNTGGQASDALNLTGTITTGNQDVFMYGAGNITATGSSLIDAGTGAVNMTASNGVGTALNPILTKAGRLNLNAGSGGAFATEADGALLVANVTGSGVLVVTNNAGALTVPLNENVRTESGAITITSADDIAINGLLGVSTQTGAGLITLKANTDGVGAQGFAQSTRSGIGTGGDVSISVNTNGGGTGNATLGLTSIVGTLTVAANAGSILWNSGFSIPADTATTSLFTMSARNYLFTTTGSIGTALNPIQSLNTATADATAGNSVINLSAGAGGIFWTDWGGLDLTVANAVATGVGNISIKAANAGGHNLIVTGTVATGSGNIALQADDDMLLNDGSLIGGPGFSGTVTLTANFDKGAEQRITMSNLAVIVTSNATANAVSLIDYCTDTNVTDGVIGGITLGNITVGNGGTITANVNPTSTATVLHTGNIQQLPGTLLDAGATGKISLIARARINAGAPANLAGIGAIGAPILTKAGTLIISSIDAPVFVTETDGASVTVTTLGRGDTTATLNTVTAVSGMDVNIASTTGKLRVTGASNTDSGGLMTLTASGTGGGVVVNAALGDADTGNVVLDAGAGDVVFNTALTTFVGQTVQMIDGNVAELGVTTTNNGTIAATNGVEIGAGESLLGTGSVNGPVRVLANGAFTPAGSLTTVYNTGNLTLKSNGVANLTLNGGTPGTQYDQLNVTGSVDVTGALLRLSVGATAKLSDTFTIVTNDGSDPIIGQFVGGTTIRGFNNPLVTFTINYSGGDGNDIVATITDISTASALLDVQGSQVLYFSNLSINNNVTVTQSAGKYVVNEAAGSITLTAAAISAGWTGDKTNQVTGPMTGVTGLSLGLSDGSDVIGGIAAGSASISLTGVGTVTINGAVTTTGAIAVDEFTAMTVNSAMSAGAGVSLTGQNPMALGGSSMLSAGANIDISRFGDVTISNLTLKAASGSINVSGTTANNTTLNSFTADSPLLSLIGSSTITIGGNVLSTGTATLNAGVLIQTSGGTLVQASTINLISFGGGVGALGLPILTKGDTINVTAGSGGGYITEADGATFSATVTGTGDLMLTNLVGTFSVAGTLSTQLGNITIASADSVAVNGSIGSAGTSGTITISANTDGAGSDGYTQSLTGTLRTTNNTTSAVTINVNTGTGTGNANLGTGIIGSATGGTITVIAGNGSILWNPAFGTVSGGTLANPQGGSNSDTLNARDYSFTTNGSIGTFDTPIQTNNFATADGAINQSVANLSAGVGGIFFTDWGSPDLTIGSAIATTGDIQLFSANASGHNLWVAGQVYTGAGNITLAADDDLHLNGATIGGSGSNGTFAGTVTLYANRDNGNEQRIYMDGITSILTSNSTANAVRMFVTATDNDATNATLGGVTLGNVTVGDGGTISVDAAASPTSQGNIFQILGTRIDAGSNGTIILRAANVTSGTSPAVGAGIRFDLDGSGVNTGPLQVHSKFLQITAINTAVNVAEGDGSFFVDADGFQVTAVVAGPGDLQLFSSSGQIVIAGATNTDGGSLTLTASGAGGGVVVNAPLGDTNNGAIKVDAGSNDVVFNAMLLVAAGQIATLIDGNIAQLGPSTILNTGAALTSATGVEVSSGDVLSGNGIVGGPVSVLASGTLSPGFSPGSISTGDLTLAASSNLVMELTGTTPGTQYDQVNVTGAVNLTGAVLKVNVGGSLSVGNKFTIINNDSNDPVTGTFAGGTTFSAANDPRYQFSISYTGGDGNDVVVTLDAILGTILDVTAGHVLYSSAAGVNNDVTVSLSSGIYTVHDNSTNISLTAGAKAAGWTGDGTKTVSGPAAGLVDAAIILSDGADKISSVTTGVPTAISSIGSVQVSGAINVIGGLAFSGHTSLTFGATATSSTSIGMSGVTDVLEAAGGKLVAPTLNLAASNGIGVSGNSVQTQATTITAIVGNGGVNLTEADGAAFTATATGNGDIELTSNSGMLTIAGPTTAATGNITLTSGDGVAINANLGDPAYAGLILISANTDGSGSDGFTQSASATITSTNFTANALIITVNTVGGGTGNALLGVGSIGGVPGGGVTVNAHNGSILWGAPVDLTGTNNPEGGANAIVLRAHDYTFTTTGAGSIGTVAAPIQTDNYASLDGTAGASNAALIAGSGGVYFTDWGSFDLTVTEAIATGAGNVQVIAANASGHNMFVDGPVKTDTGDIFLAADDDLHIDAGTLIGGVGFSGTVTIRGSRDLVNEQQVIMDPTASIVTSNNTVNAVLITDTATDNATSDPTIGGVILSNITVGDGGTITVDGALNGSNQGRIIQQPGTTLNAGPTGTVVLRSRSGTNGSAPATGAGIGTPTQPINVTAATVNAVSTNGDILVTNSQSGSFTGTVTGPGALNFTVTSGVLAIAGATNTDGGAITLTSSGGVALSATLGDSNTGAIFVVGPLSGSAMIALGTGALTANQTTASTYSGTITGNADFIKDGGGVLTLSGSSDFTGTTTVSNGTLLVNGSLTSTSSTSVAATGTLGGTGTINSQVAVAGTLAPGSAGPGVLNIGNATLSAGSNFAVDLNGLTVGMGYDQANVAGTVDVTGANLAVSIGGSFNPAPGTVFTIINNDGTDGVVGTFAGLAEGATITASGQQYTISYIGGPNGNDVTLTRSAAVAPIHVTNVKINGGAAQRSRVLTIDVTFDQTPSFATTAAAAFQLKRQSDNAAVTVAANPVGNIVTLTFTGGVVNFGSLADGRYTLTVLASQVSNLDGNNDSIPGDDYTLIGNPATNKLFRLYGDADGNGIVDGLDFGAFRTAFNTNSSTFDFDSSGIVDGLDFGQFRQRFGVTI